MRSSTMRVWVGCGLFALLSWGVWAFTFRALNQPEKSLHQAALEGDLEEVRANLLYGWHSAGVNDAVTYGLTPLHVAAPHPDVVKLLLAHGANVQARDARGLTPLHVVVRLGFLEEAKEKGLRYEDQAHFVAPSRHDALESAKLLIEAGAEVRCQNPGRFVVGQLQGGGQGDYGVVWVYNGRRSTSGSRSGAIIAGFHLANGTPLHCAALGGNADIVALLCDRGADPRAIDGDARTPLHWAALRGDEATLRLLHARGADINARDSKGDTPLDMAEREDFYPNRAGTVRVLTELGGKWGGTRP